MFWNRSNHRRRNVEGQIIKKEKECTGTDHYTGEGMYRADNFSGMNVQGPTITQGKECMVTEKECKVTDRCTGNLSSSQELSQCLFFS